MLQDFHTHTSLSDGVLSPMEMVRRAVFNGYSTIALTDHASAGDMQRILAELVQVCAVARRYWKILAIPGIELTHLPAAAIPEAARKAKELGAWIVVVHGETIVEPVEEGTNLAAIGSPHVDILAHPGLIRPEEVNLAAEKGKFLEITSRHGHSLTNGHVVRLARSAGAKLVLDSDAHSEHDLHTEAFARAVLEGAGLDSAEIGAILETNAEELVKQLISRQKV
jgi:putative hydrolase